MYKHTSVTYTWLMDLIKQHFCVLELYTRSVTNTFSKKLMDYRKQLLFFVCPIWGKLFQAGRKVSFVPPRKIMLD